MPLKGVYTWQDKKDSIKVSIPLKGASPSTVDIFGIFILLSYKTTMKSSFLDFQLQIRL